MSKSGWRFPLAGCTEGVLHTLVGKEVIVVSPGLHTFAYSGVLRMTAAPAFAVDHLKDYLYSTDKSTIMFRTVENVFISESCIIIVLPPDMVAG